MGRSTPRGTTPFSLTDHYGEISPSLEVADVEGLVASLVHPSATSETLHWGRNYLYGAEIETGSERLAVVVKQFRNQGRKRRVERRWKGSKAWRSWRSSLALWGAGVDTPEPLVWIESRAAEGPSFFVSRRVDDFLEARYLFRALEAGREREEFPQWDAGVVIERIGKAIRRLHDAGIWHRDLSIGNVLLQTEDIPAEELRVLFIDLNRARHRERLSTLQRTRDLTRLRIFRADLQQRFLASYWGSEGRGLGRRRVLLYHLLFRGFLFKVWLKKVIRGPFKWLRERLLPRHPHVHIPEAPADAAKRDRAVWDGLSDQPHQHATRLERLVIRIGDGPLHARELAAGLAALPRVRRRYRELMAGLHQSPVAWPGMGVAVRPWPEDPAALLAAVESLGSRQVLLRLQAWQASHEAEEELARELHGRGVDIAFVLAQNRDLVRDRARWKAAIGELAERFGHFGTHFQIGQAINRSKWGIWNYREYLELAETASEVLRRDPSRVLMGPAVIDYEPLRTAGILNLRQDVVRFDILASLLYVDRRGAPENSQLGFDTVAKVAQLKAIAETSPNCGDRSWITEVNWPLWEGPHSPAGRKVSVDEERQANYLVRYYLLALGSGLVERVYWWQLVARGYGLGFEDGDGQLVRRPSFAAFACLSRLLEGATLEGPLPGSDASRLYAFRGSGGDDWIAGWTADDEVAEVELPRPACAGLTRDGQDLTVTGDRVTLDGAPRYFRLEPE